MKEKFRFYAFKLTFVCVVVFALQFFINGFTTLFVLNEQAYFQIWRFITSIFLHGDVMHLLYNSFALALFGSILENIIGGKKFLKIFFITGILANLISINFYPSSLGASGAIFGVIGALIITRPLLVVWAFGLPMPIFIAGILWALGDIIGLFVPSNVANIAHLSGIGFGIIIGAIYRKSWKSVKDKKGNIEFDDKSIREWEDKNIRGDRY